MTKIKVLAFQIWLNFNFPTLILRQINLKHFRRSKINENQILASQILTKLDSWWLQKGLTRIGALYNFQSLPHTVEDVDEDKEQSDKHGHSSWDNFWLD